MNFFEAQAHSRAQTRRLVLSFAAAVVVMVAAIDLIVLLALGLAQDSAERADGTQALPVLLFTSLAVLAVITVASLYKTASLASGGAAVARTLGATPVSPESTRPEHRRLRNVVEEMAIASGTPVPQIFVLEGEAGINAFAAGYSTSDAAVTVTRGALDKLTRDELQGVIAHEFSHVLNGDMRLNIRLMGLLFGLLALALVGQKVLQHSGSGRGSSKNGGAIFVVALGVMLVGYVGLFCGRIIKAGVSRSREFLADASAVQYTRQTAGLAGALKKAAGLPAGTRLVGGGGEEVAHMLFGDGLGYSRLFATHPPLVERIRRLDPAFAEASLLALAARWSAPDYRPQDEEPESFALSLAGAANGLAGAEVVAQVGRPAQDDYRAAHALRESLPEAWMAAAHDERRAPELVLALLLHEGEPGRAEQLRLIAQAWGGQRAAEVEVLAGQRGLLHRGQYLPLAAMSLPCLNRQAPDELRRLLDTVDRMIRADARIEIFEYALSRLLRDELADLLAPGRSAQPGRLKLDQVSDDASRLLAVLARHGNADATAARRAFQAGATLLAPGRALAYAEVGDWVGALDVALPRLDGLLPEAKSLLLEALVATLSADGRVSLAEAELLRAICAALHLPLPPVLAR